MKYLSVLATGLVMTLISGCSQTAKPLKEQLSVEQVNALAKVYQFDVNGSEVTFVVSSNGCTQPEHFELKQQHSADGKAELALIRLKADRCRAMPRPYPVTFKLDGISVKKANVSLLNPRGDLNTLPGKRKSMS